MTASPPGPGGWRNLGEQPVVETPWFRLRQARVELPGGRQLDHYRLRLPPLTMTAMLDAEDRVLLLWRHRFIPDSRGWELPSGIAAPGDDLAVTASRQALAESGWEAVAPRPLLTLGQNGGLTDSAVHVFVTRQAIHHGPPEAGFEAEQIEWIPLAVTAGPLAGLPGSPEHAPPEPPVDQQQHPLARRQPAVRPVDAQAQVAGKQAVARARTPAVTAMTDSGHGCSSRGMRHRGISVLLPPGYAYDPALGITLAAGIRDSGPAW